MSNEGSLAPRAAIEQLCLSVENVVRASRNFDPAGANPLMCVAAVLYGLGAAIAECERNSVTRDTIRNIIAPARELCSQSRFVRRLQAWPRGYPGDFEAVEQLVAQRNLATRQSFAWYVEELALSSAPAQQHRNQVAHQADLMLRAISDATAGVAPAPIRILLIASGAAPSLRAIAPLVQGRNCYFVLNDLDAGALALAASTLAAIGPQCTFLHGNVLTRLSRLAAKGPFDLVLMGSLFDDLDDRVVRFLLKHTLTRLCRPGGLLYFSNIARGNPYRCLLEYIDNWKLHERDEKDIQALLEPFAAAAGGIQTWRDPTRLAIFTHVHRRAAEHA